MDRITRKQLNNKFEAFRTACQKAGIVRSVERYAARDRQILTAEHLGLDYGSKTYGRAFRVFYVNPQGGGHYSLNGASDYLGMTKREAWDTLDALTAGIYLALNAKDDQ